MNTRKSVTKQWCLVGNIANDRPVGPQKTDIRHGTKHFAPGTKLYCLPAQWGDGYDQIVVIGHHKSANKLVKMVISGDWIENWRAMTVYGADVIRFLEKTSHESRVRNWKSRQEVETYIESINAYRAKQRLSHPSAHGASNL